jgi:hypothetical protein
VDYESSTREFAISFDTEQFANVGQFSFYLNVTWAGKPFYSNKTLQLIYVTVIHRQTQVDFEAPAPTPFGDNVNFTITYLDIAGQTSVGIPDGELKIYNETGFVIPGTFYDITEDYEGNWEVRFDTDYFNEPGLYLLNASFIYTGTYFSENATSTRFINVQFRSTILSAEPVGQIGYATEMEVVLYFQDLLTLTNIGNLTPQTTLEITNDTGIPWVFNVQWHESTQNYILLVETAGQIPTVNRDYKINVSISYKYMDPFYASDWTFVEFYVRNRDTTLELQDAPLPTSYLEFVEFSLYYWDADIVAGVALADIELETNRTLVKDADFFFSEGAAGVYFVQVNTSALYGLGSTPIKANAIWTGGVPYYDDAALNVSVTVIRRPTNIEIVSPPGLTRYQDNVTFRLSVADITTDSIYYGQNLPFTKSDLEIWDEGDLLDPSEFSLEKVGAFNEYDISIKSTILTDELRLQGNSIELTLIVNWPDAVPYYKSDTVITGAIVTNRVGSVITEPVADTPKHDNMQVNFTYADEDTGTGIENAVIVFYRTSPGDLVLGSDYWLLRGSGVDAGNYTILVNTTSLPDIGTFTFTLSVEWLSFVEPFYKSPIVRPIRGSVRKIQTSLSSDPPSPSTVPINDYVSVNVTFIDEDHLIPILQAGDNISVLYKGGSEPQEWTWQAFPDGVYEITVRTTDAGNPGTKSLIFSFDMYPYSIVSIQVSFQLRDRYMGISASPQETIYAGDTTFVIVNLTDVDAVDSPLSGASLTLTWGDQSSYEEIVGQPGLYNITLDSINLDFGIKQLKIDVNLTDYQDLSYTVDLNLQQVTTDIKLSKSEYDIYWGEFVHIYAAYNDTVHGTLILGAEVDYEWAGSDDILFGVGGNYSAILNTSQVTATTVIVTITASKLNYRTATAQITLSIKPLPVEVIPIAHDGKYAVSLPRGTEFNITVYLNDTFNNLAIEKSAVTVLWSFTQINTTDLTEEGDGYYNYILDTLNGEAGKAYSITITALKPNYQGSSTTLTLSVTQTPTEVILDDTTLNNQELAFNWSQSVVIGVNVYAPSLNETDEYYQWDSTVTWVWEDLSEEFTLDSQEEAHFSYTLNTTNLSPGTYTIRITAEPNDKTYAISSTRFVLSIQKIPTRVDPPLSTSKVWGWSGWFYFDYWDLYHDIGVSNVSYNLITSADYNWAEVDGDAEYLGDGRYGVFINTTMLNARTSYTVTLDFNKPYHQTQTGLFTLSISEVPTTITAAAPEINRVEGSNRTLKVPIEDLVVVDLFYQDIDDSEGYIGGLAGAVISSTSYIRGPTITGQLDASNISLVDNGNGHYLLTFDTNNPWINATDLQSVINRFYEIYVGLELANRRTQDIVIKIQVIQIPTDYEIIQGELSMRAPRESQISIIIFYNDTWHKQGVENADILISREFNATLDAESSNLGNGQYQIILTLRAVGQSRVTISIGKLNHAGHTLEFFIIVDQNDTDILIANITNTAIPISLILIVLMGLYVRVWSVPKRLRQINGQIKALRKGKMPKPVKEACSRQELVADLYNDTYFPLEITRTPDQMPPEAIEVDIPEMGELIMQLTILTKPTPEELDEFKADIAKMKLSEQAAFVKEVIHQEAIRAARRDGKTIDETLEWVRAEAASRLGAEAAPIPSEVEEAPEEESIILPPIEEEPEEPTIEEVIEEVTPPPEEEVVAPTDRLSQYELEELQKDLEKRGVPPHEIDTIMEQAKTLPRDLVEELIRSLGGEED